MASKPRVFTIPASAPFLPALIDALMNDRLGLDFKLDGDPLALAQVHALSADPARLPAGARRVLAIATDAAILPRIVPIGDVDADEICFAEAAAGDMTRRRRWS